jgi:rhodanese-related sulfurtransferase
VAVPRISKEDLKHPYEHSTTKLPGAVRWPPDGPPPALPKDRDIVVYDSDPNELASTHVAAELIRRGYRVVALKGGIVEWLAANLPVETKDAPKQAPPAAGALKG